MADYRDSRSSRDYGAPKPFDPRPPLPTKSMMGSRIYVGKLPSDIREREVEKVFTKFGRIKEIALKGNYCFIQYESSRGAKDAVYEMHDRNVFGDRLQVEHARTPKEFGFRAPQRGGFGGYGGGYGFQSRGGYGGRHGGGYSGSYGGSSRSYGGGRRSPPLRSDYRLSVTNLSTRCDGQDLKAVMEKAGDVVYSDAHRRRVGEGIVEFVSRKDMERALKKLDGLEINGKPIKLEVEEVRKPRKSRSRSESRSKSRSRSRSHSGSATPDRKHRRSGSKSGSEEVSDDDRSKKDEKSDDEEFEEAERSVKQKKERRRKEAGKNDGSDSESDGDYDAAGDDAQAKTKQGDGSMETDDTKNKDDNGREDDDEDVEETEEIVEEVIEEEVEVEEDESQDGEPADCEKTEVAENDKEMEVEDKGAEQDEEEEQKNEKHTRAKKTPPTRSTRRSSRRSGGKSPPTENGDEEQEDE